MRRLRILVPITALLATTTCPAWAFWSAGGNGAGAVTTTTFGAPASVTATSTPGTGTVAVDWSAATLPNGQAVQGYQVTRQGVAACGGSLITTTACSDTSVPDGTYSYVVTAVYHTWTATSSPSGSVTVTRMRPSVTVNRASGQADPTNTAPVAFAALFSEPVTDFGASAVTVGGTAPGPKTISVTGSGSTYTVAVSGMTGSGTVTASIAPNAAHDADGAGNTASTGTDNTVVYDVTQPAVSAPGFTAAVTYGSYVSHEAVTLTDTAADADSGVRSVTYYYCAGASGSCPLTLVGTSTAAGFQLVATVWQSAADGAYRVVAVATDNAGNASVSGPSTAITVDATPPTVSRPTVNGRS
jgi:hypothetical protein